MNPQTVSSQPEALQEALPGSNPMAYPGTAEAPRAEDAHVRQTDSRPISRVLIVGTEFPPISGGVSRVGESLASGLRSAGVEVGLVGPQVSTDYARRGGLRFWGFRNRFAGLPIALGKAIAAFRPDVCLFMTWWPSAYLHSCLFPEVPFAVIYHGAELLSSAATLKRRIRGFLAGRAIGPVLSRGACHIPISDYTRTLLLEQGGEEIAEKVKTIANGVWPDWPASKRPADSPRPPYVLFVGRLEKTKGVRSLLSAFEEFARANGSHQLVLVGDGPLRADVSARVNGSGLSGRVRCFRNLSLPELAWLYEHCEFLVLPSEMDQSVPKVEGFGLVILEAASWKKPSIGTRSGGIPSAIVDGVTGLLVPEHSPSELCAAMTALAADAQLRNRLGAGAYALAVGQRSWPAVSRRYLDALEAAIARVRPPDFAPPVACSPERRLGV